jgi:hypothetical protein
MPDYWLKLYMEILDDPKMATLPDRLWRRIIEIFMVAKRLGKDGDLPDTPQIAWMLRMNSDDLQLDLQQILSLGIIKRIETGWHIVNFTKRQGPASAAERKRQQREREHKQQYYESVTPKSRNVTQINRLTDKNRVETEVDKYPTPTAFSIPVKPGKSAERILCDAAGLSTIPASQITRLNQVEDMAQVHGDEVTEQILKEECERYINTKGKNGRYYSKLSMGWVDWAQERLDNNSVERVMTRAEFESMTQSERLDYINSGRAIPE